MHHPRPRRRGLIRAWDVAAVRLKFDSSLCLALASQTQVTRLRKVGPPLRRSLALLAALSALAAASVATASTGRSSDTTLSIVGYSIPTAVFPKLTAAYSATPAGNGIKFTSSFAASEVQSKAVAAGLPADVVNFSISPTSTASSPPASSTRAGTATRTRESSRSRLSSSFSAMGIRSTSERGMTS